MPKSPTDLVVFGPSDWWVTNPSCTKHIMLNLRDRHRVLYINPVSSDLLGMKGRGRSGLLTRIRRKAKSLAKIYRKHDENFYVFSPLFIPIQGTPIFDWINNQAVGGQISLVQFLLRFQKPMLWVENVRAADFLHMRCWHRVVFHVSDLFEDCPYTKNKEALQQREQKINEACDLMICVSKMLYDNKVKQYPQKRIKYLPHGVDFNRFREAAEKNLRHQSVADVKGPIIGYFGSLTAQNDIALLEHCARQLPDYTFVFAGLITAGDYSSLAAMSNVRFIGRVDYTEIPALCNSFDVCLLAWMMNPWMANCNPLKLMEYFASGRPVVSIPINEIVENYSDVVSVASDPEDFCQAIQYELTHDTVERSQKRVSIAASHSWSRHADIIEEELKKIAEVF